jgi:ABC-type branched-subunit amino acid transport system substrate-binding protein
MTRNRVAASLPRSVAGGALAAFVAACGSSGGGGTPSSSATASKSPVKLGLVQPLSGPLAYLGTPFLHGFQAAVNAANASGGAGGHRVDLIVQDDQGDTSKNIVATRDVASQGAVAIYEDPVTNVFNALVPLAASLKITLMSGGTSSAVLVPAQQYIFGSDIPPPAEAPTELGAAAALLGKQNFTLNSVYSTTPASEEWGRNVATLAPRQGATVLHNISTPTAAADMTSAAEQAVSGNPDVILGEITEGNLIPLITKIRQKGYTGPIINYHGAGSDTDLQQLADKGFYAARTSADYGESSAGKPGVAAYQKATDAAGYVKDATGNTQYPNGYVAGIMYLAGIEKCGDPCTNEKFSAAMNSLDKDTGGLTFSPVRFTSSKHQGLTNEVFYSWDGSKVTPALNGKSFTGILPVT